MSNFIFHRTVIDDVFIIEPKVFGDDRGYFMETYHFEDFKAAGIPSVFVQDNQSRSSKGVLRGLHFQTGEFSQAKLVRVISGEVYDVAVDIRQGSPTFGKYVGVTLSGENKKQFFIPRHFAHGFLVLSDEAEFVYKCDALYAPEHDAGIMWNDPEIGIEWPDVDVPLLLSEKDGRHPRLRDMEVQ